MWAGEQGTVWEEREEVDDPRLYKRKYKEKGREGWEGREGKGRVVRVYSSRTTVLFKSRVKKGRVRLKFGAKQRVSPNRKVGVEIDTVTPCSLQT